MPGLGLPKGSDSKKGSSGIENKLLRAPTGIIAIAGTALVRGQVYLVPFSVEVGGTLQKAYQAFNTPSGTVRYAIYNDGAAGFTPANGTKVVSLGNIGQFVANPTAATFAQYLSPGLYWFAFTGSTSASLAIFGNSGPFTPFDSATFSYRAGSVASNTAALPDTVPASVTFSGVRASPFFFTFV